MLIFEIKNIASPIKQSSVLNWFCIVHKINFDRNPLYHEFYAQLAIFMVSLTGALSVNKFNLSELYPIYFSWQDDDDDDEDEDDDEDGSDDEDVDDGQVWKERTLREMEKHRGSGCSCEDRDNIGRETRTLSRRKLTCVIKRKFTVKKLLVT